MHAAHDHHAHGPHHTGDPGTGERALWIATALTFGYAAVEAAVGWWAGSLALIADAGHMLNDAFALGLAAAAAWVARRPPSNVHSYGMGRAEFMAALINGVTLLILILWISISAVQRLLEPRPVIGGAVSAAAAVGLIVNLAVAWMLSGSSSSLNVRAAFLHVIGDLLASVAALIAGIVIMLTGWTPIDALLSLLICALLSVACYRLLRETLHGLMEGVPRRISMDEVGRSMAGTAGVMSVHDLHIWSLSPQRIALSAHVVLRDMSQWESVLRGLSAMLRERYGIEHITLQPERGAHVMLQMPKPPRSSGAHD